MNRFCKRLNIFSATVLPTNLTGKKGKAIPATGRGGP
jgi:hypothetical protein